MDPLKTKLVALSGRFRGLFVDDGAPPAIDLVARPCEFSNRAILSL